jgi:hypothetical protein
MNPNATWNVSLESYHPYLQPQEVSKGPTTLGTYGSLPKNKKGRFVFLSPLGVNRLFHIANSMHFDITIMLKKYTTNCLFYF